MVTTIYSSKYFPAVVGITLIIFHVASEGLGRHNLSLPQDADSTHYTIVSSELEDPIQATIFTRASNEIQFSLHC